MPYELKEGQGTLFKNVKSKESQPDYKGEVNVNGVVMELAAWEKTSQRGTEYLSVSVKPKQSAREKVMKGIIDMDDNIPF